jgi:hypothetical protein
MPYRVGHTRESLFSTVFAGGDSSETLKYLPDDKPFGRELAQMKDPSATWALLLSMLETNRSFDSAFATWWHDPNRCTFLVWAATNGIPK